MTPTELISFIEKRYKKESGFRFSSSNAIAEAIDYLKKLPQDTNVLADPKSLWGLVKVLAADDSRLPSRTSEDTSATCRVLAAVLKKAPLSSTLVASISRVVNAGNRNGKLVFKSAHWITQPDTTLLTGDHWQLIQTSQSPVNLIAFFAEHSSKLAQWPLWQENKNELESFLTTASEHSIDGLRVFLGFFLYKNFNGPEGAHISANLTMEQIRPLLDNTDTRLQNLGASNFNAPHHLSSSSFDCMRFLMSFDEVIGTKLTQDALNNYQQGLYKKFKEVLNATKNSIRAASQPSPTDQMVLTDDVNLLEKMVKFLTDGKDIAALTDGYTPMQDRSTVYEIKAVLAEYFYQTRQYSLAYDAYAIMSRLKLDGLTYSRLAELAISLEKPLQIILECFHGAYRTARTTVDQQAVQHRAQAWMTQISLTPGFDFQKTFTYRTMQQYLQILTALKIPSPCTPSPAITNPQSAIKHPSSSQQYATQPKRLKDEIEMSQILCK